MIKNQKKRNRRPAPMVDEKHNAKTVESAVFVNMVDGNNNAKTVETEGRHAPMASKDQGVRIVEKARHFAHMIDRDTSVKNVAVLAFAITAGKNTNAKIAKGVRFASMTDKGINAKNVLPAIVNTVKSNLGVSSAKKPQKAAQPHSMISYP